MARLRTERATSAGGIVVRVRDGRLQLVVGMRRRERGATWTLPKGTPRPGETLAETALREVGEETGLVVEIKRPIGSIRYTFTVGDTRIEKTVHYFLMAPRGGHLARHDREFARVRWLDLEAAPSLLTFETERELVARVARLLTTGSAAPVDLDQAETEPAEQQSGTPKPDRSGGGEAVRSGHEPFIRTRVSAGTGRLGAKSMPGSRSAPAATTPAPTTPAATTPGSRSAPAATTPAATTPAPTTRTDPGGARRARFE